MITIRNISKTYGKGEQTYLLIVDAIKDKREVVLTFTHCYEDGLAACLRAAADEVERLE